MLGTIESYSSPTTTYFENTVGRLVEHPAGHYIGVEYGTGPRHLADLQDFLTHAGQLLARWGWEKLLGYQGLMASFTTEEIDYVVAQWRNQASHSAELLYGAQLLPHNVFARLSFSLKNPNL